MYDPQYTMQTTINGQLMLTMLAEMLMELPNSQIIQINTDGATFKLHKSTIDKYYEICNTWMQITNLQLEYAEYSKMILLDVNNYVAFYTNGKYKAKGRLEFENIPFHKNKSHNIIPIAFYKYFKDNVSIEETILTHTNIFDFCAGKRAKKSPQSPEKGQAKFELHYLKDGELIKEKLSKTIRYFISKKGKWLFKVWENNEKEYVEAPFKNNKRNVDWKVTYFNKYYKVDNFQDYDIDYRYYISKTRDLIYQVEKTNQLNLF